MSSRNPDDRAMKPMRLWPNEANVADQQFHRSPILDGPT